MRPFSNPEMSSVLISSFFFLLVPWFDLGTGCPTLIMSQSDTPGAASGCEDASLIRLARYASTTESTDNGFSTKNESAASSTSSSLQTVASTAAPLKKGNTTGESVFGYEESNGPETWPNKFPFCGGQRQSPISIILANAVLPSADVNPSFYFNYYDLAPQQMSLVNNGKTITLSGTWNGPKRPTIKGAVLDGEYVWEALHFHWGADEYEGSEHSINGERYPMEMHMVHSKKAYGSLSKALTREDGISVVGFMFEIQKQKNPAFELIIEAARKIIDPRNPPVTLAPFPLDKLAIPFTRNYVSYLGSLTTPPCSEIVTWIVNLKPLGVSKIQLQTLRKLLNNNGDRLMRNFRPTQLLNNREIKFAPS